MLLFSHPAMLTHDPGREHPEQPARLKFVLKALESLGLDRRDAPLAPGEAVLRLHAMTYLDELEAAFFAAQLRRVELDINTAVSAGSREAAWRAAGAGVAAVDAVMAGEDTTAFCAVRPPGHHAEPDTFMGFCLFNNVAIAALHALEAHGLERVAVVDFDVHHGNGTQTLAEREPRLFFASTHESPLFPGTGAASETGVNGNVLNAPLPAGAGSAEWRAVMEARVLPAIEAFQPQMVFVSAGFDAHRADLASNIRLEAADYAWVGARLKAIADGHADGRLVACLEGGYDLDSLAASARAFVSAVMTGRDEEETSA